MTKKKSILVSICLMFAMCFCLNFVFIHNLQMAYADTTTSCIVRVDYGNNDVVSYRVTKGSTINLQADETLADGSTFYSWYGNGVVEITDIYASTTTARINGTNALIEAQYREKGSEAYLFMETPKDGVEISTSVKVYSNDYYYVPDETCIISDDVAWYRGEDKVASAKLTEGATYTLGEKYTVFMNINMNWDTSKERTIFLNGSKMTATGNALSVNNLVYYEYKMTFIATELKYRITIVTPNGTTTGLYSTGDEIPLSTPAEIDGGSKIFGGWNDIGLITINSDDTKATVEDRDAILIAMYMTYVNQDIEVQVAYPINDCNPEFKVFNKSEYADVTDVYWTEVSLDSSTGVFTDVKELVSSDTFEKGKLYKVSMYLSDGDCYYVEEGNKVLINGIDVTSSRGSQSGRYFLYSTVFTATDAISEVLVENGIAKVDGSIATLAEAGKTVTLVAEDKVGQRFAKWQVLSGGITLSNANSSTTTFTMPASNVSVKAIYNTLINVVEMSVTAPENGKNPDFSTAKFVGELYEVVNISWYKGEGAVTSKLMTAEESFVAGEKYTVAVKIKAKDGYIFNYDGALTTRKINGIESNTITGEGTTESTFKATFTAVEEIPSRQIELTGGRFEDDTTTKEIKENELVTIVADAPKDGYQFDCWKDTEGNTLSSDEKYTFLVSKELQIVAHYKAINTTPSGSGSTPVPTTPTSTEENAGLPAGVVVAIVLGCALVAGLGGFALVWFVVKKKSWAELMTAIKNIFKKKV